MNVTKNQIHIRKIDEYVCKCLCKEELDNSDLVQIIERINDYLNLKTIQKYATDNNISYNGARNNRTITTLFGVKFIADNE